MKPSLEKVITSISNIESDLKSDVIQLKALASQMSSVIGKFTVESKIVDDKYYKILRKTQQVSEDN